MNLVETLLHPKIARIIESGDTKRALKTAKKVVHVVKNDAKISAFERSGELSNAWFQIALVEELLGNLTEAAVAAKNAYEYDNWMFHQHPTLVRLAVTQEDEEMYRFAVGVAKWHKLACTLDYYDGRSSDTEIYNLLEAQQHLSSAIKWYLEDRKFNVEMDAAWTILVRTGEVILDAPLSRIKQWRREGRNPVECDVAECKINYFMQRNERVLEIWGDQPLDLLEQPLDFARLCRVKIDAGQPLPDPLPLPKSLETNEWFVAAEEIVHAIWKYLSDGFVGDFSAEQGEEFQARINQHLALAQKLCLHCMSIYDDFLNGKQIGRATSPFLYAQLLRLYGITLEKSDEPKKALAYYRKAMTIFPFPELAQSIISAALDLQKGELAMSATQWLERNFGETFSFEDAHRNDRLRLWAVGLYEKLPNFLTLLRDFQEKYHELQRVACGFNFGNAHLVPTGIAPYMDEYLYAINNVWHALEAQWDRHPGDPDLIAEMLENRYYFVSDHVTCLWIDDFLDHLVVLRDGALDEHGRQRLFKGLNAAGFLVGRIGMQDAENPTDPQRIQDGLRLLEEAAAIAESTSIDEVELMRNLLDRGRFLHEIGELKGAEALYTRVIERLGPGNRFPQEILDNPTKTDLFATIPLDKMPTYLLFLAYYFRGYVRAALDTSSEELVSDFRDAYAMHPTMSQLCLSLAELLLLEPETTGEALKYAVRFIELEPDVQNPDRAVMLAIVADNYLDAGRTSDAKYLIYELERNFPSHAALPALKEKLA